MSNRIFRNHIAIILAILFVAVVLRVYSLASLPISPYWEEVAVAYDAYSLLQTGHDHHGNFLPVVALESFGDWKPSGYAYAQIPSIAVFGLHTFALRLPAAISGVSLVILAGYVSWKLTQSMTVLTLAMALTAISPWQIIFSRAGWEVMLATALFSWGAAIVTRALLEMPKKSELLLILGCLSLSFSAYTYHAMRLLVPLFLVSIALFAIATAHKNNKNEVKVVFKNCIILALVSFLTFIPFLRVWGSPELGQRFAETSIFSDIEIIHRSNEAIKLSDNSFFARVAHHRYVEYSSVLFTNYLSHFSPKFLFITGDVNPRHATGYGGHLYGLDSILLIAGVLAGLSRVTHSKSSRPWAFFICCLVFLSPIPASVTNATPHALRTLPMSLGLLILVSVGAQQLLAVTTKKFERFFSQAIILTVAVLLYSLQPIAWWRHYTAVYSITSASQWQYGYRQLYEELARLSETSPVSEIYVSRVYGRPAMYLWFYRQTPPSAVQEVNSIANKDQGEYLEFDRYKFFTKVSEIPIKPMILAVSPNQLHDVVSLNKSLQVSSILRNPQGEEIWYILTQFAE